MIHAGKPSVLIGRAGEDMAAAHLESLGHKILHRGWRYSHYEIDLITEKDGRIHFVEVKTRCASCEVSPLESVTKRKRFNMSVSASAYVSLFHVRNEISFDVVSVLTDSENGAVIEYIEEAFLPFY